MPGIGVSMTLTFKYFIHQVFILYLWEVIFVLFAIFGPGKVLWFCLRFQAKTKVIRTYIGFVKICKLVPNVVKKKTSWQDIQETKNSKKSQNIPEFQFQVYKGNLVHFKSVTLQNLDCTDCTLVELYFTCLCQIVY